MQLQQLLAPQEAAENHEAHPILFFLKAFVVLCAASASTKPTTRLPSLTWVSPSAIAWSQGASSETPCFIACLPSGARCI